MPVMNGMDSARGIRKLERERGQKPAMIISSGVNHFLTKPVSFNELRKFLNEWTPDMEVQTAGVSERLM
jgi:CheY-like chemotaxis protein